MNIEIPIQQRIIFQNWLREQLKALDFYQKRGDFYLIREFMKYCVENGHPIDEASLGRYINKEQPVVPTPDRCRALALVLGIAPIEVMKMAGHVRDDDWQTPA